MDYKQIAKLVNKAKKGETEAFAQLYSYFAQPIYYIALRILKNEQDANDIVQETILKLYKSLDSLKNPMAVTSFVNKTAYNYCISFLRSKKEDLFYDEPDEENITHLGSSDEDFIPEKYLEKKEKRDYVISLIDELSYSHKSVILMYYFEDLPIKEIAEILEISEQATKNRIFRAKENLKTKLISADMKGVIMTTASATVLSKILTLDAGASFSPELHANNWNAVAIKYGLSATEVAAATKTATSVSSFITNQTATSQIATAVTTATTTVTNTGILLSIAVSGAIIAGSIYFLNAGISTANSNQNIPIVLTQENINQDINSQLNNHDRDDIYTNEDASPPEESSLQNDSEEGVISSSEEPIAEETISNLSIIRENNLPLRYKIGTKVTPEMVIQDAKVSVVNGSEIIMDHFEKIDINKPDEYGVYIRAKNNQNEYSERISVIVIIEK